VPSFEEIPFHNEPLRESATERSGAHNVHQHPSAVKEASQADELITARLREALALIQVRVVDHIIVAGRDTLSMAEQGLL